MENQKEDATESDTNVNESNAEDGEEDVEGSEIVDKSAGAQPTSRGREEEDAIMVLEEVLEVVSDGRQEEEEEEEEVEEEEVTPTNTVREEEVHSDLEDSGSPLLLSPLSRFSPDRRSTMSQLRRRVQSLLRTESGRRTLARVHRRGTLPPQMAQMLEEMLREARDREGGGDEVDAGEGGEEEVQNMKEVLMSAVPLSERRRLREVLASRGALRGKKDTVKIQSKATKRSRRNMGFSKLLGLDGVESRFGSAAASVFGFMLWTTALNVACLLLVLLLVLVPQLAEDAHESDPGGNTFNEADDGPCDLLVDGYWALEEQDVACCSQLYHNETGDYDTDVVSVVADLLQGTGFMEYSPFYYGYYSGTFQFEFGTGGATFDFPLAYFLVMLAVFLVNLVAVVYSSAKSFGAHLKTVDKSRAVFSNMVFGFWDYRVSTADGVKTQHEEAATSYKVILESKERKRMREEILRRHRFRILLIRILINFFAVASLACVAYFVYFLLSDLQPRLREENDCDKYDALDAATALTSASGIVCFLVEYLPSVIVTASNMILPAAFTWLIQFERYTRDTELVVNLIRCIFLRLASLAIAFYSVYFTIRCNYKQGCYDGNEVTEVADSVDICETGEKVEACTNAFLGYDCIKPICWETFLAQELYKLTVTDFLVQTGLIFLVDYPRTAIFGRWSEKHPLARMVGVKQFDVPKHVLDIVYSQTICWLAVFYAPLFLAATAVKTVFLYCFRMFYIRMVCSPSTLPYSATRASSLFKYCLLLSFSLVIVAVGFSQAEVQPSTACGPFRDIDCADDDDFDVTDCSVFDYIGGLIERQSNEVVKETVLFIMQGAVLYPLALLLLVVCYSYYAYGYAQLRVVKQLKRQLADVHREKAMLQKELAQMQPPGHAGSSRPNTPNTPMARTEGGAARRKGLTVPA